MLILSKQRESGTWKGWGTVERQGPMHEKICLIRKKKQVKMMNMLNVSSSKENSLRLKTSIKTVNKKH